MSSQYAYLVTNGLLRRLQAREPGALRELVRGYNRGRPKRTQLPVPAEGDTYGEYPVRLLALLWALTRDKQALSALGQRLDLPIPAPLEYHRMGDALLELLWVEGADGEALEEYWTRRGLLPVGEVSAATPSCLLGFLWWYSRRQDARDLLFQRYHRALATDQAQDRAEKILVLLDRWDYLRYPELDRLLTVSLRRARMDARADWVVQGDDGRVAEAPDLGARDPSGVAADRDELAARSSVEQRIVYKSRLNSETHPQELTTEELAEAAVANWECAHPGQPAPERWLIREKERINTWLAGHPEPTGADLQECFPWYEPADFDTATRRWRLRLRADRNDQLLGRLLAGRRDGTAEDLAGLVQESMDELVLRVVRNNRLGKDAPAQGPVVTFGGLTEAAEQLWAHLAARDPGGRQAEILTGCRRNLAAFCAEFPVLIKLASCRRAARWLSGQRLPVGHPLELQGLLGWLERGRWLATFPQQDKERARQLGDRLGTFPTQLRGERRSALELVLLWLRSAREPGLPKQRLRDLDRVWWCCRELGVNWPAGLQQLANAAVAAACRADWSAAARRTSTMLRLVTGSPGVVSSAVRELQDCLVRLNKVEG
jgi:hypothetical protein